MDQAMDAYKEGRARIAAGSPFVYQMDSVRRFSYCIRRASTTLSVLACLRP